MTTVYAMEPMLPEDPRHELADLCLELTQKASHLAGGLSTTLRASVGDLVRSMNCYYSNLIEGHDTHPISIDQALAGDYSTDPRHRDLQKEAVAHIEVQRMIDRGAAPFPVVSTEFLLWVHREFCTRLPADMLWVPLPGSTEKDPLIPGEFRRRLVRVGQHVPIAADEVPTFLARFQEAYDHNRLSRMNSLIAAAASHHRLLWIHPFLDGNGRVARLFSHALLLELQVGSELWSVSRGLARTINDYKAHLMAADGPRRGDLDGRGNLTMSGLTAFCRYFLRVCIDQVEFMGNLLDLTELQRRMEIWAEEEMRARRLPRGSWQLLREAVIAGAFQRGQAGPITGYEERQARSVLKALLEGGFLVSPTARSPVRLGFPATVVERWLPKLYPPGPA